MLNAQQVEALQNAEPTDWARFDKDLQNLSDSNANRFAMDSRLHVRFFMKPMLNVDKSTEANRAIYEDTEFIEIMIPGDKQNILIHAAEDFDRQRFPQIYERFKSGRSQVIGTPLSAMPFLTPAQVEEYRYFNIVTAEQLAEAPDSALQRYLGAQTHKQKAREWLAASVGVDKLRADYEADAASKDEIIRQLTSRLEALEKVTAKRKE